MKSYKVRIFYNGYYDTYIDAPTEEHARDIAKDFSMDYAQDAIISYDFVEVDEIGGV